MPASTGSRGATDSKGSGGGCGRVLEHPADVCDGCRTRQPSRSSRVRSWVPQGGVGTASMARRRAARQRGPGRARWGAQPSRSAREHDVRSIRAADCSGAVADDGPRRTWRSTASRDPCAAPMLGGVHQAVVRDSGPRRDRERVRPRRFWTTRLAATARRSRLRDVSCGTSAVEPIAVRRRAVRRRRRPCPTACGERFRRPLSQGPPCAAAPENFRAYGRAARRGACTRLLARP